EAEDPDPVDDKGLLAGVGVDFLGEPEAHQQVGAESHPFPAHEHHGEARAQHQRQHEKDEQIQVRKVARVAGIVVHVADAEDVNEGADAGDDQNHHRRQLSELQRQGNLQIAHRKPLPIAKHQRGRWVELRQLEHGERRGRERQHERADACDRDRALRARCSERQRAVHHEARERQRRHHPEQRERERGKRYHPLSRLMFCRSTVWRCRYTARMIASPTAASAAATAMTKNTKIWPATPSCCAKATNARLAAFSISSTHMKMTIALRRSSTPSTPTANRTPETARAGPSSITASAWRARPRRRSPPGGERW